MNFQAGRMVIEVIRTDFLVEQFCYARASGWKHPSIGHGCGGYDSQDDAGFLFFNSNSFEKLDEN